MKILYEGVDIYPDISVHRCYHDMYAEKQSDELLLKLNDTRELWDSWNPKKGDSIAIEDGAAKTGKMFVESVVPESGIITMRAYSVPQSAKDKRSKSWEKVKFLQLAQEIAGRHGLTLETYGITDQTYDYVEQNNLADFAFFQNRCTLEGAAFLVYDGKLVVYDEAHMESQQPVDTITITPANDFEYRELGLYAEDPDPEVGEVLYCYGNCGDLAEWIPPSGGATIVEKTIDIVTAIGTATNVTAYIPADAYATKEDYETYKAIALGAQATAEEALALSRQAIAIAQAAEASANDLSNAVGQNTSKIATLWDAVFSDITSNPFQITFADLTGITLKSGVWNASLQRLEC